MTPRPVFVEWVDACDVGDGWTALDDFGDDDVVPCGVVSVGWLLSRTESALLLAMSITEGGDVRAAFLVPTSAVRCLTYLTPGDNV